MNDAGFGGHLVEPVHAYNAAEEITTAMGFKVPERFFADPTGKPPPEPKPDPKMLEVQRKGEQEAAKLEIDKAKVAMEQARLEYEKQKEPFELKGGFLDGKALDTSEIATLATLPSLDQLRGKLVALVQAPATKLVRLLNEPGAQLARLVEARRGALEEGGQA